MYCFSAPNSPFRQLCENRSGPFTCFSMQANCILRFLSRGRSRDTAGGKDFASRFWWALYLLLGHLLPQCTWWLLRHVLCLQCPMASNQLHLAAASSTHPQAVLEQSASGSCRDHSFSRVQLMQYTQPPEHPETIPRAVLYGAWVPLGSYLL